MRLQSLLIAGVMAVAISSGTAYAQSVPQDRVYAFHSGAVGQCPGLDWHVVAKGDALSGMISWGNGQHIARVQGNITAPGFQMTAQEIGTSRTADISGNVSGDGWLVANIEAPGVKCKAVQVRWFTPATFGGGGGGG